jgi:hypothetical protein
LCARLGAQHLGTGFGLADARLTLLKGIDVARALTESAAKAPPLSPTPQALDKSATDITLMLGMALSPNSCDAGAPRLVGKRGLKKCVPILAK